MSRPPFMPAPESILEYRNTIEAEVREQVATEIADAIANWCERENLTGRAHWAATRASDIAMLLRVDRGGGQ